MLTTKKLLFYSSEEFYTGIYISRAPVLCLAPGPSPGSQFVFIGRGPNFCLPVLAPNLYLPTLAPNSYSTALAPNCIYRPWPLICIYRRWHQIFIYWPWSVWSLGLHIPNLTPVNLYLLALAYDFYYHTLNLPLPSYL